MAFRRGVLIPAFSQGSTGNGGDRVLTWGIGITQDIAIGTLVTPKIIFPFPSVTHRALRWIIAANTGPTGHEIVINLKKNGTTIFLGTDANKVVLPAGSVGPVVGTSFATDPYTFDYLDVMTADVVRIGTTIPGFRIEVHLVVRPV